MLYVRGIKLVFVLKIRVSEGHTDKSRCLASTQWLEPSKLALHRWISLVIFPIGSLLMLINPQLKKHCIIVMR